MFRVIGFVSLLALCAGAVHADEDRTAYTRAQAKLTEQLNAVIARGVDVKTPPPPADLDENARRVAQTESRASS